ncbi:MAG: 50S ribosomal protein L17 [Candidatus Omnitrophica bacterium]|nr:50S ribosomal protein L17 [Candidatus Omnitrophota bacterium]
MRHRKIKGKLNRRRSWRKATMKSMTNDLLTYQRIETTMAKARALRSFAEPLITLAKNNPDSVSARRQAFSKLCDRRVVKSLFEQIAPLFKDVPGGYTRIMRAGNRKGDGADLAIMELTRRTIPDEELLKTVDTEKEAVGKKSRKGRKADKAGKKTSKTGDQAHSAPVVDEREKEEHAVEDVKKTKAREEQQKVEKKGIFKRFRRKSG